MSIQRRLLTPNEISDLCKTVPLWEVKDGKLLYRTLRFIDFVEAFAFITKVAIISERMSHHPEWRNVYAEVEINLTTHDLCGISNLDFKLAKSIDELSSI